MGDTERGARWEISDVLDRTDLSALLDELAQPAARVMGAGRRWHCPMPDHADHRASVSMRRDQRGHERWRCWSGDHRGDAIDLVMITSGRTKPDAIEWLANRAGMTPDRPLPPIRPKRTPVAAAPARVMDPIVARYVMRCAAVLRGSQGAVVRDWLHDRGITDDTIRDNRIGMDPGRMLMRRRRGLPYGYAVAATFPALDPAQNITFVQARYLDADSVGRKYDNPSGALAPHPRIGFAAHGADRSGLLVVCEGIPDALTASQAGFTAVALMGADTPDESVAIRLANHARGRELRIALVCDPDIGGRTVARALPPLLAEHGCDQTIITPPGVLDLNDWALADPDWATHLDALGKALPIQPAHAGLGARASMDIEP